jgi:hypothetical protein
VDAVFDHDLAGALGHEQEAVPVAVAALLLAAADQLDELAFLARLQEPRQAGVEDQRLAQVGLVGHGDAPVVAVRPVAAQGVVGVAQRRRLDDAGDQLAPVLQADERRPDRDAPHERAGAVDRVDDPAVAGRSRRVAVLLAEEPVAGERLFEARPKGQLRLAVGERDRRLVALGDDFEVGVEVAKRDLGCISGDVDGLLVAGSPVGVHASAHAFDGSGPFSRILRKRTHRVHRGTAVSPLRLGLFRVDGDPTHPAPIDGQ